MTAGFPGRPAVSVVVPVFNEADVLGELVSRCVAAIASAPTWELVVVDDASTDGTRSIAAGLCVDPRVRVEHLAANRGQLGATLHGLAASRGEWVVVLDGDLQDPPEVIGDLIATQQRLGVPVVLAVKAGRHDPVWMRAGSAVYHALQRLALPGAVPGGMGSFALFPGAVARAMAGVALPRGNLGAVLLASRLPFATVPYRKAERYDASSRVGARGLVVEALSSLALTGALERLLLVLALLGVVLAGAAGAGPVGGAGLATGVLVAVGAAVVRRWRRARLDPLRRAVSAVVRA